MWKEILMTFLTIAGELLVLFVAISFVISLVQQVIPYDKVEKQLAKNRWIGATFAILFAFITPFCSCSTIPVVVTLLKKHIPFGTVMVFLFASPVLDPTILTLMTVMLGWKVAIIYTVATTIFSVVIGFTLEWLGFEKYVKNVVMSGYAEPTKRIDVKGALLETLQLMKSVFVYILIGAGIGAIIHEAVPTEFLSSLFSADKWWIVPIAAIVGIPLYIRLASMIPISNILLVKGMALGPVMAMMISSAGASLPELVLLKSIFKKELVAAFVVSVVLMASLSGMLFYWV